MTTNKFSIDGMTCESCVEKITEKLKSIPQVQTVKVDLKAKIAVLESPNGINLDQANAVLGDLPKYKISEIGSAVSPINLVEESKLKTYKPLVLIFTYILLVSLSYQVYQGSFHFHIFMNHIMAGFFIGLSFFKFLDLKAFAESFSSYDPLAQRIYSYGKVYPFVELILGLMFISEIGLLSANIVTIVILSITTFGVTKRLQSKSKIQCACAGAGFNLPLSYVTVFENVAMILMAFYGLVKLFI